MYQVSEPEKFVKYLKSKNIPIPTHYLIEIFKKLLDTVKNLFSRKDWDDTQRVTEVSDLLLAIGHSLIHLKNQSDYVDLENFLNDCTLPFESIVFNCIPYEQFKNRLNDVENFYLHTKKQNEINEEKVLMLCEKESNAAAEKGFLTNINSTILKKTYEKYVQKYGSLVNLNVQHIIGALSKNLKNIPEISQWSPSFKQNTIPLILAHISAVWTKLESEDVTTVGDKIKPHCVQIMCIFRMLGVDKDSIGVDKRFCQVSTGQGKSIILALLSALLVVTGHIVYVACYSAYLAKRDKYNFSEFFKLFEKFDSESKVNYTTIDSITNEIISPVINKESKDLRNLVEELILDELPPCMVYTNENSNRILLIDEADVFFSKKFYGKCYNPVECLNLSVLLEIQPKIWSIVKDGIFDKNIIMEKINEFINLIIIESNDEQLEEFMKNNSSLLRNNIEEMICEAIEVKQSSTTSDEYKINDKGIISTKDQFGFYCTTTCSYFTIFSYFKLKKSGFDHKNYSNYGYLLITCGSISYANVPKEYPVILGVSGTLTTLNNSEIGAIKSYGIDTMTVMPSFFGSHKLKFQPVLDFVIEKTEESWMEKIYGQVNKQMDNGRAVLVFFETEKEIKIFNEKFRYKIDRLHVLTGNENPSILDEYINEAGLARTVTLATSNMGRGVDFKSNDLSVEQKGGTHVIQTFFSLDEKEEIQIKGRTARKDNKGSYELILCMVHLKNLGCWKTFSGKTVENYQELCSVRKSMTDLKGASINLQIQKSDEKHNLTMNFLKSFSDYTPSKREAYLTNYQSLLDKLQNG